MWCGVVWCVGGKVCVEVCPARTMAIIRGREQEGSPLSTDVSVGQLSPTLACKMAGKFEERSPGVYRSRVGIGMVDIAARWKGYLERLELQILDLRENTQCQNRDMIDFCE